MIARRGLTLAAFLAVTLLSLAILADGTGGGSAVAALPVIAPAAGSSAFAGALAWLVAHQGLVAVVGTPTGLAVIAHVLTMIAASIAPAHPTASARIYAIVRLLPEIKAFASQLAGAPKGGAFLGVGS